MEKRVTLFGHGLIWFGAAVSIAEILTGALVAPLGFTKGLLSIILGHTIGCVMLYFAGLIGAKTGLSAMDTVKTSFGKRGGLLFAGLNVLQLVGWTAVMTVSAASAAKLLLPAIPAWAWCLIVGALIALWVVIGIKDLGKVNTVSMIALFVLSIVLCVVVFKDGGGAAVTGDISFGAAVELSVAMPLSWLPLISDYTREATGDKKREKRTTLVSSAVYFLASCFMFIIGMGAAIFTGEGDVAAIMLRAGLGIAALIIVVLSTVTTTFLDVYSAGVSVVSISKKAKEKTAALIVTALGTAIAIFAPVERFEDFLYLIGSVFAPMIALQIADNFILKRKCEGNFDWRNLVLWAVGFALYRVFMGVDIALGSTLPDMAATIIIAVITDKIMATKGRKNA